MVRVKRMLDIAAYTISGLALAGGAVYGLSRLLGPEPLPPAPALPQPAVAPAPQPPPPQAAVVPPPPPPVAAERPRPPEPPPAPTLSAQDQSAFDSLQRNCYEAAANNRNGEYPALQTMACTRYQQFAGAHGLDTGPMPEYGQAQPQAAPQPPQPMAEAQPPAQDQQPQVIYLPPGSYPAPYHRPGHRWPDQPDGSTYPQRPTQIGPNHPLPPPQQPPPVSQRQQPQNQ